MFRKAMVGGLVAGAFFTAPVQASDDVPALATFSGGIGVLAAASGSIRGVAPAGAIWAIDSLGAKVRTNGRITVVGKGLVFGNTNNAGRTTNNFVAATFQCDNTATAAQFSTPAQTVQLSTTGDFKIDAVLSPLPPATCASPMLLIRNGGSATVATLGGWFAVGILDASTPSHDDGSEND
jgi:hypothetical protein